MKIVVWQMIACGIFFKNVCMSEQQLNVQKLKAITQEAQSGCAESMFDLAQYNFQLGNYDNGMNWLLYFSMRAKQDIELLKPEDQLGKWAVISEQIGSKIRRFPRIRDFLLIIDPEEMENKRQDIAKILKGITEDKNSPLGNPYWLIKQFADFSHNAPKFIESKLWQSRRLLVANQLLERQQIVLFTPIYCPNDHNDDFEDMPLPPLPQIQQNCVIKPEQEGY